MPNSPVPKNAKIYVAGHSGLVGSAIVRVLKSKGYYNLLLRDFEEVDLRKLDPVEKLFASERPEYVYLAAAKVGGILANSTFPVEFIQDNLQIQINVISSAHRYGVKKLLFLGSSCIYPKLAPQPIKEDYLLTGPLEPTNQPYAMAKIAGIELVNAYRRQHGAHFISVMPTNLYGPGDNFDLETSHVLPALLRKFHEAKVNDAESVKIWGTGNPRREFLYVDDLAEACLFLMDCYDDSIPINVGLGEDVSICELAELIREIVGFKGKIIYDQEKPDGTPQKLLDSTRIKELGWKASLTLEEGIKSMYKWYVANVK